MKIELADVSGVPEALKPVVMQDGDKHYLDLTALAPMAEVEKFKGKALTAQQEAIERRKALDAWSKLGASPDEIAAKLTAGPDPKIVDQMRAQHASEVGAWKEKFSRTVASRAAADLRAELARVGVVPEGLDVLAGYASSRLQIDDDGNVRVMAKDGGTPMVGSGANGGATLADLAAELAKTIPHLVADKGAGGGGKPPGSGGTPGQKTMNRAAFLALAPAEQAKLAASGVKPID